MRHRSGPLALVVPLLGILMLLGASAPAMAQQARPHGAPIDASGWRVADERELEIEGEPISLSPDGQWIAGRGPDREFCVWKVETLDPVCDAEPLPIATESLAWAPDSSAVAFSLDFARLLYDSDIFVFTIETGTIANLTDDGDEKISLETPRTEGGPILIDLMPTWSLDGTELTFGRTDWTADILTTTLMTIPAAGGEPVELLTIDADGPAQVISPMRRLDDGSLLYTVWMPDLDEPANGLWRYEPGEDPVQLVKGTESDDYPVPVATDVYEADGRTIVLGFSPLLGAQYTRDPDRSIGFALDLETGATVPLEEVVSIDNADAGPGEETVIFAPARISPDRSAMVLGVNQGGQGTLAIASTEPGEAPVSIDVQPRFQPFWAFQGYTWASNDTILVPLAEGPVVLLTLERSDRATPAAPCSCTPPPQG